MVNAARSRIRNIGGNQMLPLPESRVELLSEQDARFENDFINDVAEDDTYGTLVAAFEDTKTENDDRNYFETVATANTTDEKEEGQNMSKDFQSVGEQD